MAQMAQKDSGARKDLVNSSFFDLESFLSTADAAGGNSAERRAPFVLYSKNLNNEVSSWLSGCLGSASVERWSRLTRSHTFAAAHSLRREHDSDERTSQNSGWHCGCREDQQ